MIAHARRWWPAALLIAVGSVPAATVGPPEVSPIVWEPAEGPTISVRVDNVPAPTLRALRDAAATDPRWPTILAVRVVSPDLTVPTDRPAIGGKYQVVAGNSVRFTPRFPLDATRRYRVTFDPDGVLGDTPILTVDRAGSPPTPVSPTLVTRVEPTADRVPANLLKFYLSFSAPMARGDAYAHLQLVDAGDKPLDHPFLELGEELWDPTQTRLTVLLDPGRIKRGLRPREELGPIFMANQTYTLKVDPAWRDAAGNPLGAAASKTFATTTEDETSPDPRAWRITAPRVGSSDPLVITFGDTLDRATVRSGLTLLDPRGVEVGGTGEALADGTAWKFSTANWLAGTYTLTIDPDLEDLAGNSVRRPFEVDVQRDVPVVPETKRVRLPVVIGP